MAKMKTLTVSGQTYTVCDPEAVSFGEVQALTPLQQQTARENIGACTEKTIQDKLCPGFTVSGSIVACQPVQGYPLTVTAEGTAARITRCGKNLFGGDALVEALESKDNGGGVTKNESEKTILFEPGKITRTGHLFNKFKENTQYTVILRGYNTEVAGVTNLRIQYTDETAETFTFNNGTIGQDCPANESGYVIHKTKPGKTPWRITPSWQNAPAVLFYEDCGVFEGDVSLEEFEAYQGETFENGEKIPALPGMNTLWADSGALTVTGRSDLAAEVEKLKAAILSADLSQYKEE